MTGVPATLSVAVPLVAAAAAVVMPRWRTAAALAAVSVVLVCALTLAGAVVAGGPSVVAVGGWPAPLGIEWRIDGFAVTMLIMTGVVGLPVTVYARHYFGAGRRGGSRFFWALWLLLLAALSALFLSNDLFHWYVTLELLGISAVALVTLAGNGEALSAAQRYLYAGLLGSLCYLMGVALIYTAYGTLDLDLLRSLVESTQTVWVAVALMLAGLLMKSAVFPMHAWLPLAHGSAPAPVSAILSALVAKGAFYIVLRVWYELVPAAPPQSVTWLLGAFGAAAIIWGSVNALRTPRLKMLVAYSTVAQLGYLALIFPLGNNVDGGQVALTGVIYFICAHACAKGAMFLAAGNLQHAAGHDRLDSLNEAAQSLRMSLFAFAVAAVSIMGLPPSGGFMAKWTLLNAALLQDEWIWFVVIVLGGLLAAAYVFRVLALSFTNVPTPRVANPVKPVSRCSEWACIVLASMALLLGLNALPMLELTSVGLPELRR